MKLRVVRLNLPWVYLFISSISSFAENLGLNDGAFYHRYELRLKLSELEGEGEQMHFVFGPVFGRLQIVWRA